MEKMLLLLCALVSVAIALPTFSFRPPPVFNPQPPQTKDCVYGAWTAWSPCNAACDDTAFISRTRAIIKEAHGYGRRCDNSKLEEWKECRGGACARDCQMDQWSEWSQCSAQCDQGQRQRWRQVLSDAVNGGASCGRTEESEPCFERPCAVDCQMDQWSQWSACSAQCEEGRRARTRSILVQPQNNGLQCGPAEEWEACNNGPCAQDCAYGDWQAWSQCPVCGNADRSRSRPIVQQGAFGGQQCDFGSLFESESCNNRPCAVDCVMSFWSAWSRCSADCGQGRRSRTRSIVTNAAFGGFACGPAEEWEACQAQPCAVDCEMNQWESWSFCSANCDGGRRSRLRSVKINAAFGGLACGPREEWEECNSQECPRDCAYNDWQSWSPCPVCGNADRSRSRSILSAGNNAGQQCDFGSLFETESCNNRPCAVDCQMSQWTQWSRCSADCDEGRRSRTRQVLQPAQFGGLQCGPAEDWEACNNGPCKIDCELSSWSEWTQCSVDCDAGRRSRVRFVQTAAVNGGRACGPAEEWSVCNNGPCPQDCALGNWAEWSQCPVCGQASRSRSRPIVQQGAFGGQQCDFQSLAETESCNLRSCAVDCVLSQWASWSRCSADCGQGRRSRARSILTAAVFGGRACGPAEEWEACVDRPCQVDCQVSQWSSWSSCSAECGSGRQSRTRGITQRPNNGGLQCPALEDWRQCNNAPCRQPSVCDGVFGTEFIANGCSADFILCANGVEHAKICPGPSRFDVQSKSCRLPSEVAACRPQQSPSFPTFPTKPRGYGL